jgi:hypothetical protein
MKKTTMTKALWKAAHNQKGEPLGNGPKCATCGDLAAWGAHPACEKKNGKLIVWR